MQMGVIRQTRDSTAIGFHRSGSGGKRGRLERRSLNNNNIHQIHVHIRTYIHMCTQSICTYVLVHISYVPSKRDVQLIQSHSQMITNGVSPSILGEYPRNITSLCHGMGPWLLLHCLLLLMLYVCDRELV